MDNTMDRRITSLFSLAQKAGKLVTGEFSCEKALRNKTAQLVIAAIDASENTKKKFSQKCFYYKKPFCMLFTKDELSAAIGKENRATFAVCDAGFAKRIIELMEETKGIKIATGTQVSEVDICPK